MLHRLNQVVVSILIMSTLSLAMPAEADLSVAVMKGDMAAVKKLLEANVDVNASQGDGSTALHWAAYREEVEMVRTLLDAGAVVDTTTRLGGMTPLFMAAKVGNAAIIDLLVQAGADVNSVNSETGTTSLMLASASGNVASVQELLNAGAVVDARDMNHGQTALMFAAAPGRIGVIKLLAEHGADVNATSLVPTPRKVEGAGGPRWKKHDLALGGMAPLQFAARDGRMGAVKALLKAGADVNKLTTSNNMSALTIAILNTHFDVAMSLLEQGADPKSADSGEGVTALYAVIDAQWANRVWYPPPSPEQEHTHYLELIEAILERAPDVNVRLKAKMWQRQMHGDWVNPTGATPFWRAAQANDVAAMKLLIAAGSNPSIRSKDGVSALQVATGWGYEPQTSTFIPDARLAAVRYLVEEVGLDVNEKDNKGYTALHGAGLTSEYGTEVISYLVTMGADVNAQADMILGGQIDPDKDVEPGTGDTVADMANGPKAHNLVHPGAVSYLEDIGSPNSYNCRASTCVNAAKKDSRSSGGQ